MFVQTKLYFSQILQGFVFARDSPQPPRPHTPPPPPPVLLNPGEVSILVTKLLPGPSGLSVPILLCFSWFRTIFRLQFNRYKSSTSTIFPQHAHIDGFHDPQLPSTLKPNKTTRGGPGRLLPNRVRTDSSARPLMLFWCDASSLVRPEHLGRVPTQPDSRRLGAPACPRTMTHKKLASVRACQQDRGPPVCD